MKTVIFTDLDDTLLDTKTFSWHDAQQALDLISEQEIPLVLCSSKTRVEMELYRQRLHNLHPFSAENGGGIFVPVTYFPFPVPGEARDGYIVTTLGLSYEVVREKLKRLREELHISAKGFGDMTVEDVAQLTGLSLEEAALSRNRDFSEPFVIEQGREAVFLRAIERQGLQWTRGRFHTLMGAHDKGAAVRLLKKWYECKHGKIVSIGLGDALNDLPLLREVDYPVLVQKDDGQYDSDITLSGLIKAPGIGPAGWNSVVLSLLTR